MKFIDKANAYARAGDGGNGCISFRKKRFQPKGGPDGGDGGQGGNVVFVSDPQLSSLTDLSHRPRLIAKNGQQGKANNQSGKSGGDLIVRVPVGTLLIDSKTGEILQDLDVEKKRFVAARGGRGGRGNARFATSTDRAPRRAEKGEQGEDRWLRFELKLVVDVGLIGRPNAGKSTLISKISSANPRIAAYPFTTTSPNLGVVTYDDFRSFTVADIPGLIENAHKGSGLGTKFLKHVERTKLLVHVLDITRFHEQNPVKDYGIIVEELKAFDPLLEKKPHIVAINKVDLLECLSPLNEAERGFAEKGILTFPISALTGQGLTTLINAIGQELEKLKPTAEE
jgi:GTP-binding protein